MNIYSNISITPEFMCWQHGWVSLMMNIAQYYPVITLNVRFSDLGTEMVQVTPLRRTLASSP